MSREASDRERYAEPTEEQLRRLDSATQEEIEAEAV